MRRTVPSILLLSTVFSAGLAVGCEKAAPADKQASSPSAATAKSADPAAPAPHASADPHAGIAPSPAVVPTEPARAGGLTWEAPAPFIRRAPKTTMRAAEYGVKGAPQAEMGVFYFGPQQGGGIEANIARWVGQFAQADGSETKAKRGEKTVQGVKVATVEAQGMFSGGMAMPGAPQPSAVPDAMLLGAIAEGPEGSVFFKLTGPRDAVEGARDAFEAMLESIHK